MDVDEENKDDDNSISCSSDNQGRRKKPAKLVEVAVDKDDSVSSLKNEESYWLEFFYYCIDMTAANLMYIVQTQWNEILRLLSHQVIWEIINKTIQFYKSDPNYDNRPLIQLMLKIRKCNSVF